MCVNNLTYTYLFINKLVTDEMNRVYDLFIERNGDNFPSRKVSIIAHSLGSIICFDILARQKNNLQENNNNKKMDNFFFFSEDQEKITKNALKLNFQVENCFMLGSPTGMFLNLRDQQLNLQFNLPTCDYLYNIFHPYDPVAYRLEPLIANHLIDTRPTIVSTFEGKLRFQYQLKNQVKHLWKNIRFNLKNFELTVENFLLYFGLVEEPEKSDSFMATNAIVAITEQVTEHGYNNNSNKGGNKNNYILKSPTSYYFENDKHEEEKKDHDLIANSRKYGRLCRGYPIDYTLQENEFEITNEYLFALTAHVIYWTNRDLSLFMAKKIWKEELEMKVFQEKCEEEVEENVEEVFEVEE